MVKLRKKNNSGIKPKIYLAGGINSLSDSECIEWREEMKNLFPECDFLDPMVRDYRGQTQEKYKEIVEGDLEDIEQSNVFIAYMFQPSVGTSMEIVITAIEHGLKPIVFWDNLERKPSPWLLYFSDVCTDKKEWLKKIRIAISEFHEKVNIMARSIELGLYIPGEEYEQ